ncbi:hypothetical protein A616_16755 [Brevibacillus brevis X23]|nr:hypothetical protein A616_16755 [Brevibacillus brevis X23]
MKIALVSCSKNKRDFTCAAAEMYSESTLFTKATSYIKNQNYERWFILSALHGLLDPALQIEPYDVTLNNMSSSEIKQWASKVMQQLQQYNIDIVDFYAGDKYRKYLVPLLEQEGIASNVPLKGMGIGQQLQFYTQNA